mgnify:CR=1 FL=1
MSFADLLRQWPVMPAPMCGITDRGTRDTLRHYGAGLAYTEMLSMEGLVRKDRKTYALLDIEGEPAPVVVQIFGSRPQSAAEAARILQDRGVAAVDLNMGCPARKVVGNNCGSALLKFPALVADIVKAVVSSISIPFTVKMRWDFEEDGGSALEIARICEAEGAQAVALHARTRAERYRGHSDWSRIAELKSALNIPVIGNGDVRTPADAQAMMRQTGCDGVMIGRGLLGNPWIFQRSMEALQHDEAAQPWTPSLDERLEAMRYHAGKMAEWKGERYGLIEFRKHAVAYLKGLPNANEVKNAMMHVGSMAEMDRLLEEHRPMLLAEAAL